ncbi:hypothetical protein GOBAR_AA36609 [Gossypium barbadense]|uniref:Transketolase-like pyrimidine-binding domain-containing protein n=1 Tax=Gossypium barbadense TaxID=3634 RepID=A0A2P5VZ24_GOSBA|nr:hypothetical protein GOBAR_AA36609 [Gossypium barbadense]
MASTSSLTLSQALLARTIFSDGSTQSSDYRLTTPRSRRVLPTRLNRSLRVSSAAVETIGTPAETSLLEKSVNTIRFLAIDAVEKANSGHPGLPMGCAPMGHVLYDEIMRYNRKNPYWFNRDRFVLSAGHGCMLQYALLHLAGYDSVQEDDLKNFRQWRSRTPGHPENFETPGVEVTTGPLGQGIANAVGLALTEKFNKPNNEIVDHYTYYYFSIFYGDGCQMEGVANEACSLARHWGLGKLIAFYDDNHISIGGDTEIAFTENVEEHFKGRGWHVIWIKIGNTGYDEIRASIKEGKGVKDKPTLIKVIYYLDVTNNANLYNVYDSALGAMEVDATRKNLTWPHEPFHVPKDGATLETEWNVKFLKLIITGKLSTRWKKTYTPVSPVDATRNLSQQNLNALVKVLPGFLSGSASLASSNMTLLKMYGNFQKDTPEERNLWFGVREHGMGAICNGITHHSPDLILYCATFFVFTDYMRAAIRMSVLIIYVMTHDSIGIGENGSTHQPIEHLASFRAMPNVFMLRPADGNETAGAYKVVILNRNTPSIIAHSPEKLPQLPGTSIEGVEKGDNSSGNNPDIVLIETDSELEIALKKDEKAVRVVSLVSWELFDNQSDIVGSKGKAIEIDRFGASAPAGRLYKEFGLIPEAIVTAAKELC